MRQARKLESIGLLVGGIAHDFNNLLTGVIGNAGLLMYEVPCDAQPRVQEVLNAGERAANLTRQLLVYAGKGHFHLQAIDLSAVVRDCCRWCRRRYRRRRRSGRSWTTRCPPFSPSQIEQVLMNLVINAGEAVDDEPGEITIRTRIEDLEPQQASVFGLAADRYACIEVADTGCGMDEVTEARIFEPFFTTEFTGRGLGLAAVHGVVRSCKGGIRVETAKGVGARFTVVFPVTEQPANGDARETKVTAQTGSGVVLLVDDEEMIRSAGEAALRRFGFDVITVADGKEAVERFSEHLEEIDEVLLDVKMPVMDGHEALEELKGSGRASRCWYRADRAKRRHCGLSGRRRGGSYSAAVYRGGLGGSHTRADRRPRVGESRRHEGRELGRIRAGLRVICTQLDRDLSGAVCKSEAIRSCSHGPSMAMRRLRRFPTSDDSITRYCRPSLVPVSKTVWM